MMKITLQEEQSPNDNDDYINGLQFVVIDDEVFVQIHNQSICVSKEELRKVLHLL